MAVFLFFVTAFGFGHCFQFFIMSLIVDTIKPITALITLTIIIIAKAAGIAITPNNINFQNASIISIFKRTFYCVDDANIVDYT